MRVGARTVRVLEVAIPPNTATVSQLAPLQGAAVWFMFEDGGVFNVECRQLRPVDARLELNEAASAEGPNSRDPVGPNHMLRAT